MATKLPIQSISDFAVPEPVTGWDDSFHQDGRVRKSSSMSTSTFTPQAGESSAATQSSPENQYELEDFDLGSEDPNILLNIFRSEMSPNFPFITLSEFTRAEDLRRDRPTLYTAILGVTTRNSQRGIALGKAFMKQLAERMMVNGERNMDLLLGALTYVAWYVRNALEECLPDFDLLLGVGKI